MDATKAGGGCIRSKAPLVDLEPGGEGTLGHQAQRVQAPAEVE